MCTRFIISVLLQHQRLHPQRAFASNHRTSHQVYMLLSTMNNADRVTPPDLHCWTHYLSASDPDTEAILAKDMLVYPDFVNETEETNLLAEVEPYMKRLRYERDHWDNVRHISSSFSTANQMKWYNFL